MKQCLIIKSFLLIPSENNSPRLHHEDRVKTRVCRNENSAIPSCKFFSPYTSKGWKKTFIAIYFLALNVFYPYKKYHPAIPRE